MTERPRITLTDFTDIIMKSGTPKATAISTIKHREEYAPEKDFYKPLRERIIDLHEQAGSKDDLRRFLATLTDDKKRSNYPAAVSGYTKWWGRQTLEWFAPPAAKITRDGIELSLTPELGLTIDGRPHVIKLHFKAEPLAKNRAEIINHALATGLRASLPEHTLLGVLDVRRSRLQQPTNKTPTRILDGLLEAELAYISSIWPRL